MELRWLRWDEQWTGAGGPCWVYVDSDGFRTRAEDLMWQGPLPPQSAPEFEPYPIEILCRIFKMNPMEVLQVEARSGSFYRKPLPKTPSQMVKEVTEKYKKINRAYEEGRRSRIGRLP